jgi:hypothetical protein
MAVLIFLFFKIIFKKIIFLKEELSFKVF